MSKAHKKFARFPPCKSEEYYLLLRGWARSGSIDWHPFFLNGCRMYASATVVSRIGASALPTKMMRSGWRGKSHISSLSRRRDVSSRGPTFIGRRASSSTIGRDGQGRKRSDRHVRRMVSR